MVVDRQQASRHVLEILRMGWLRTLYRSVVPHFIRLRLQSARIERNKRKYAFPRTKAWLNTTASSGGIQATPSMGQLGVNVVGYLRSQFGLGESARNYVRALRSIGVHVSLFDVDLGLPHKRDDSSLESRVDHVLPHPVTLMFINPDYLDKAMAELGQARHQLGHVIGCWFWELERLPNSWLPALEQVDEVMVSTSFVGSAIRRDTNKPILRAPLPLSPLVDSGLQRADFGINERSFVFLFTFDFASWLERKNPVAVTRAFRRAFPSERNDVQLVIKSSNGYRLPDWMRQLEQSIGGDPRIILRDEVIDKAHLVALQRCADAYVSLHRAEGFGLGMAECMALGKPVIATGWSGNLEFMDSDCAALVDYKLVPVPAGAYLDSEGQRWAEPDEEDAVRWLRRLADDRDFSRELGERGRKRVEATLSVEAVAHKLRERLVEIDGQGTGSMCPLDGGKVPGGTAS